MMTDGSQPLADGQHETFAKLLAKGGMSQAAAYAKAGYKNDRTQACKTAAKHSIPQRVAWLKKQSATAQTLTQIEKRERLAAIVRGEEETRDILSAIKIDNEMDEDSLPERVEVTIDVLALEISAVRARK